MSRRGLSKRVVTHNAVDLSKEDAVRLNGVNRALNPLMIDHHVYTLKHYLQTRHGNRENWKPALQLMLEHRNRMDRLELEAVKRVMHELDGTEGP